MLVWLLAKDSSSDECESAATDVHTQFLGLNFEFTQELRLDNQSLNDSVYPLPRLKKKKKKKE